MARKHLLNMLQVIGVTGLSQATSNVINGSGNSQEFYEASSADALVIYVDCSAVTGSPNVAFTLNERDPATGLFFAAPGVTIAAVTGTLATPQRIVVDPCLAECYQLAWVFTGSGSATVSVVGLLIHRD